MRVPWDASSSDAERPTLQGTIGDWAPPRSTTPATHSRTASSQSEHAPHRLAGSGPRPSGASGHFFLRLCCLGWPWAHAAMGGRSAIKGRSRVHVDVSVRACHARLKSSEGLPPGRRQKHSRYPPGSNHPSSACSVATAIPPWHFGANSSTFCLPIASDPSHRHLHDLDAELHTCTGHTRSRHQCSDYSTLLHYSVVPPAS
ncbi:unnamed protein product [Periconia digitata]|uniref:Uncharacterized protein n=1 Tax=Periconia digitata TaxID=1303443 RepID=A0A9W4XLC8_9PLEO|nr:unnamed protein product [Periconia digitata]